MQLLNANLTHCYRMQVIRTILLQKTCSTHSQPTHAKQNTIFFPYEEFSFNVTRVMHSYWVSLSLTQFCSVLPSSVLEPETLVCMRSFILKIDWIFHSVPDVSDFLPPHLPWAALNSEWMSRLSTILRDTEQTVTSGARLELKALSQVGEVSAGMWCSSSQCVSGKKLTIKY